MNFFFISHSIYAILYALLWYFDETKFAVLGGVYVIMYTILIVYLSFDGDREDLSTYTLDEMIELSLKFHLPTKLMSIFLSNLILFGILVVTFTINEWLVFGVSIFMLILSVLLISVWNDNIKKLSTSELVQLQMIKEKVKK